jgi:hypothetical protein
MIGQLQPRLAKIGLTLVDTPSSFVDPDTNELVVPRPTLPFDAAVLDEVDEGVALGRTELPLVEWGRYPLDAWFVYAVESEDAEWRTDGSEPLRPALAVASTINQVVTNDDRATTAATLAGFVKAVPVRPVHYETAAQLTALLAQR